jgi:hypothetical protein
VMDSQKYQTLFSPRPVPPDSAVFNDLIFLLIARKSRFLGIAVYWVAECSCCNQCLYHGVSLELGEVGKYLNPPPDKVT